MMKGVLHLLIFLTALFSADASSRRDPKAPLTTDDIAVIHQRRVPTRDTILAGTESMGGVPQTQDQERSKAQQVEYPIQYRRVESASCSEVEDMKEIYAKSVGKLMPTSFQGCQVQKNGQKGANEAVFTALNKVKPKDSADAPETEDERVWKTMPKSFSALQVETRKTVEQLGAGRGDSAADAQLILSVFLRESDGKPFLTEELSGRGRALYDAKVGDHPGMGFFQMTRDLTPATKKKPAEYFVNDDLKYVAYRKLYGDLQRQVSTFPIPDAVKATPKDAIKTFRDFSESPYNPRAGVFFAYNDVIRFPEEALKAKGVTLPQGDEPNRAAVLGFIYNAGIDAYECARRRVEAWNGIRAEMEKSSGVLATRLDPGRWEDIRPFVAMDGPTFAASIKKHFSLPQSPKDARKVGAVATDREAWTAWGGDVKTKAVVDQLKNACGEQTSFAADPGGAIGSLGASQTSDPVGDRFLNSMGKTLLNGCNCIDTNPKYVGKGAVATAYGDHIYQIARCLQGPRVGPVKR